MQRRLLRAIAWIAAFGGGLVLLFIALLRGSDESGGALSAGPAAVGARESETAAEPRTQATEHGPGEPRRSTAPPRTFSVPPAETVEDVAEAAQPVGARLRVQLTDCDTGAPLAGLRLRIQAESLRDPTRTIGVEGLTDDSGVLLTEAVLPRALLTVEQLPGNLAAEFFPRRIEPESFSMLAAPGETFEVELCARAPSLSVALELQRQAGAPIAGARVALIEGRPGDSGSTEWFYWRFGESDERGLASIPLYGSLEGRTFCAQVQQPVDGEVCDPTPLPLPIGPGPYRLYTYPGGAIDVLALDAAGEALAEARVTCWFVERPRMGLANDLRTDAAGRVRFAPLPAGRYLLALGAWATSSKADPTEVSLSAGEQRELVLRPAGDELERLIVSGSVYEPDGSPAPGVLLGILLDGVEHELVFSDERGEFEYRGRGSWSEVLVSSATTIYVDPIEPAELRVAPGTRGLEFHKTDHTEERQVVFRLFDARSGEPLADSVDAEIVLYRRVAEGSRVLGVARFGPDDGATFVDYRPHADLAWRVLAPGYQEVTGELPRGEPGVEVPVLDVHLSPGFRRELTVRSTADGARLAGVVFRDEGGEELARSASDGRVELFAAAWPGVLEVTLAGYEPLEWDAGAPTAQLWLVPAH